MMRSAYPSVMSVLVLSAVAGLAACGDSQAPADAGPGLDMNGHDAGPGDDGGPIVEACTTEGATRSAECGNCGIQAQACMGGAWTATSACTDERECAPGTSEHDTARCGDRTRVCDDICAWRAWTVTTPQGECEAPETRTPAGLACSVSEVPVSECSPTCTWIDSCRAACEAPAAASRTGAVPICIPRGPFILGSTASGSTTTQPVSTVTLSSFYIDRDMVTAGRYRACIAAGVCTAPAVETSFAELGDDAIAVQISYDSADAFCAWDGGRLPTEYQWEKAARGPAPGAPLYTYAGINACGETEFCMGRIVLRGQGRFSLPS